MLAIRHGFPLLGIVAAATHGCSASSNPPTGVTSTAGVSTTVGTESGGVEDPTGGEGTTRGVETSTNGEVTSASGATAGSEGAVSSSEDTGVPQPGDCDATGFHVEDGTLFDARCSPFVFRGINYPYVWFSGSQNTAGELAEIAGLGANAVRVVLANGQQWTRVTGNEVSQIIGWAKENELIAILEVHDATGWSEQASAANPDTAVDYWLGSDIRTAIDGQEAYVLINVANEPLGNDQTAQWVPFHSGAIAELRAAGVKHTLVVDAPNWGQDWTNTMLDGTSAQQIWDSDPDGNVVFSVHMYDVYGTESAVSNYLSGFLQQGLPLIVGEFAADHGPGNPVAAQAIMTRAQALGVGYLGWSWSGNSGELSSLDVAVNFNGGSLSSWGQLLIHGTDGIAATSVTSKVYAK